MLLLSWFRKKDTALSTGKPVMNMSNKSDAKFWKMAYLAIGKTIADAEKKGEDISFTTAFKRSKENYQIILEQHQKQLQSHDTGTTELNS